MNKYSIWLEPESEIKSELHQLIKSVANRFGTFPFLPHVTLLGGLKDIDEKELIIQTESLIQTQNELILKTDGHQGEAYFFRSYYFNIKETDELNQIHSLFKYHFFGNGNKHPEYCPHLSVLYSNIKEDKKIEIINSENLEIRFPVVSIWNTTMLHKDWYCVKRFLLKNI